MSTNPYAQSTVGAPASAASPEQQQKADYELAIGPNNDYYLPKFEEFDNGGSEVGWHWPAFFVTSPWFLYRKMYAVGVLNLLYPWVLLVILSIVYGITKPPVAVMVTVGVLLLFAPTVVLPMFASALYWRQARKVIRNIPSAFAKQPDKRAARIERNGGVAIGPMIGVMLGLGFFGIGGIGIMAAIAIPAYDDYSIRSQITEGLNLASPVKAQVAEVWASQHRWAEQADIGDEVPGGKYVTAINVTTGSVIITYGGDANKNIAGLRLAIQPLVDPSGDIYWACGNAAGPDGWTPSGGPSGATVADKYLPRNCRSGT